MRATNLVLLLIGWERGTSLENQSRRKVNKNQSKGKLVILLYIELAISFLIGRKRTVNFGNQRLWRHTCRLYNNHVKVTGNHVMYDRGALFPWIIMSSSRALCGLPSVKKQNNVQVCKCIFMVAQCIIKQLLDEVFVISRIIKVKASAGNSYLDLDYSGYHKNLIQ